MRTKKIARMIRDAVADEERSGRLAKTLEKGARQRGMKPSKDMVQGIVSFVREYVEHVPLLMQQAARAARQMGLGAEMGHLLGEVEKYWFEANDLVPDHWDSGGSPTTPMRLCVSSSVSDYCQTTFGRPLLQQNLTAANQGMRGLIGDPVVSILEQRIGMTLANVMMQRLLSQITAGGVVCPSGPDPIWGNASIDDIVKARLGAMGVV